MLSCPRRLLLEPRPSSASLCGANRWRRLRAAAVLLALATMVSAPSARARTNSTTEPKNTNAATKAREVASGKAVFDQRCEICHYTESTAQKIGPGLKGLYARMRFAGGEKVKDAVVTHWIETGGKNMPGFKDVLKPAQINSLIAYLKTL